MPLAISALSAAAASTTNATRNMTGTIPENRAEQVPETVEMPIPIPTPSPRTRTSDSSLRSRTFLHAQQQQQSSLGVSSARLSISAQGQGQGRSVSTPSGRLSSGSSDESISSAASKWNGEMSYEQIGRDEAAGIPPSGVRPGFEKRRSSWWGWAGGSPGERDKVE